MNWVEKAGFENIRKLLEISERERHHEILLTVENLCELSRNPSPYIMPVIPRPLHVTPILKHISFKPFQICGSIFVHYGRPINI